MSRRKEQTHPEQALADAKKLVDAGRPMDAIRLLTEANRVRRDRKIEQRLVDLRFETFRRMDGAAVKGSAPSVVDDLFPGELIPEIKHDELTVERVRSAILHHGSLVVRGLVRPDNVARLIADIDTVFDAFDADVARETRPDLAGWYNPVELVHVDDKTRATRRRTGSILAVDSPPTLFDLIEVLNEEGLGDIARDYLDEPPTILARKVTLRRMGRNATGGWHQDGAFMGRALRALNIWMALTPCGDDAPSLDVVGRRIEYIVPVGGSAAPYAVSEESAERVAEGSIVHLDFEPGDALLFDHMLLHRTGWRTGMTKGRYAIETWLMAPSTYGVMTESVEEGGFRPADQVPLIF